jgi:hypothetical protein
VLRPIVVLALLAGALLAGCGGGDDGDDGGGGGKDEQAIREVVRQSITTDTPEIDCDSRVSDSLIRRTYGDRARCVRVQRDDEERPARSVDFDDLRVDGDSASVRIVARGGDPDGARGTLELVREDGDWRIDDLSTPLLRSLMEAGLRTNERQKTLPAGGVACIRRGLSPLRDAEFRRVAFALMGETTEGERRLFGILADCPRANGRSLLRELFDTSITTALRSRTDQRGIDCVLAFMRRRYPDNRLTSLLAGQGADQALGRALVPAFAECGVGSSQSSPGAS